MKKILAIAIVAVLTVALCVYASADDTITVDLSDATGNIDVQIVDGKVVCTTNGADPWVSIPVDNIDTNEYGFFTVRYSATKEVGSNNTYLMDTEKNPNYSGTEGTWHGHGMGGTADGAVHEKTYEIAVDFPAMVGTTLTGVRFTCCGETDGVFTVESLVFSKEAPKAETPSEPSEPTQPSEPTNPGTADASVIAIAAVACVALAGVVVAKKVR